jgi:superfamily II DNA or RNA helicase
MIELFRFLKIGCDIRDERFSGTSVELAFQGILRPEKQRAADDLLAHDTGVLSASTAFGKTVVAAWLIARRGVNTLVLVHRRQLLDQWVERLGVFLGLPPKEIGKIGGGKRKPTGRIDVAVIQSLSRKGIANDLVGGYGHLVVDECHHLSARSFEIVARQSKARFVTGLSATVTRKDGHHPIIFMNCGPIRHRVDDKQQAEARPFEHRVAVRRTGFRLPPVFAEKNRIEMHELYAALVTDEARNQMILDDVLKAVRGKRSPVVLTERTGHLEFLASRLAERIKNVIVLKGGMGAKQRNSTMERLAAIPENDERVIVATGRYLGEGFDDARLDTLFLALPISWKGTLAQYAGRLHRLHHAKREVVIYDYADLDVPMLAKMFDRRCHGYKMIGYELGKGDQGQEGDAESASHINRFRGSLHGL